MYLHQKLHTFREGIAGSYIRPKTWLIKEIREIIEIAKFDNPKIIQRLLEIHDKIDIELKDNGNMRKRIEIDQLACAILNEQEKE